MSPAAAAPKRVLVPLAPGCEEIEAVTIVDVLRRAGVEVVVAGLVEGPIVASRGVRLLADVSLAEAAAADYDAVVLPGGLGGTQRLAADPRVRAVVERARARRVLVGAICAAPVVLSQAGVLAGRRATSHPSVLDTLDCAVRSEDRVVTDDGIVTSRGAGTALEFALELVRQLAGPEAVEELRRAMVA